MHVGRLGGCSFFYKYLGTYSPTYNQPIPDVVVSDGDSVAKGSLFVR